MVRHVLRNRRANVVRYVSAGQEVKQGRDLRLSMNLRLQYITYRALKEAVTRAGAAGGSAVLVDALTGEVIALAAQPAFNPNDISTRQPEKSSQSGGDRFNGAWITDQTFYGGNRN